MSTKNKDLVFGDVEIDEDEFEPRHVKVRVTTMIDQDIIVTLKQISEEKGQGYQTILNQILRAYVSSRTGSKKTKFKAATENRIREIVRQELRKRVG
jgi:competence protein ComGF